MIPSILNDVVNALKSEKISIADKIEGEGRGGSLQDEGTIIRFLQSNEKFGKNILNIPPRGFGDMLVVDYDQKTFYVVNIKTSIGSSDNATSKLGFLYAFTNLTYEELPRSMGWKKFHALLKERKADMPNKDYWYLCVDKNDSSNVMVRGCKQIANWVENANPANLLQINWKKEKLSDPVNRTYDEAYDVIVNGISRCFRKTFDNLPEEMKEVINA